MSSVKYDSVVNRAEAEALKEMIFKRARERAQALENDVKNSYTSSMKNDIMELARDSFVSEKNPFAQTKQEVVKDVVETKDEAPEVGFPPRKIDEIKSQISYRTKTVNDEIVNSAVATTMADARADFKKKESFMGALNFLNAQATVSLIKSKGQNFEALA